jgi:hypothetical protein
VARRPAFEQALKALNWTNGNNLRVPSRLKIRTKCPDLGFSARTPDALGAEALQGATLSKLAALRFLPVSYFVGHGAPAASHCFKNSTTWRAE